MFYYIFKVTLNNGDSHFKLNNVYIGYVDFDSDFDRNGEEYRNGTKAVSYQVFASGTVEKDAVLHFINCESLRFDERVALQMAEDYGLTLSQDTRLYKVYHPDPNSSKCYLKEINGEATIE